MAELTVHKKGYYRKPYSRDGTRVAGARVSPSTFKIKDRGAPGRGEKVIPDIKEGGLGGAGFFGMPKDKQHAILGRVVRNEGKQVALGRLRAVQVFQKRTNPKISREAAQLGRYVQTEY